MQSVLRPGLLEKAADCGLRSLFVGFETLEPGQPAGAAQGAEPASATSRPPPYDAAIRRLHDLGVMVNASFVFGMDDDDETVFERTVDWAVAQGIETATFHILTPYPGTALHAAPGGRGPHHDPRLGPLRHAPRRLPPGQDDRAERWRPATGSAYRDFYSWRSIARARLGAAGRARTAAAPRLHGGWKKLEPLWDLAIRSGHVQRFLPLLEAILTDFGADGGRGAATLRPRPVTSGATPAEPARPPEVATTRAARRLPSA